MKYFYALFICLFTAAINTTLFAQCDNLLQAPTYTMVGASGGPDCYVITYYDYYHTGGSGKSAVWCNDSVDLNYDFDLQFNVTQSGSWFRNQGEGMMFVLQNTGTNAIGDGGYREGGNLGYYSGNVFQHSLGVELDLAYSEGFYDTLSFYIPPTHMTIVKNGNPFPLTGLKSVALGYGTYPFRVTWNHTIKVFSVYLDGNLITSYTNDLVANIFNGNSKVIMGFTGSTGIGGTCNQSFCVSNLSYHRDLQLKTIALQCGSATLASNAAAGVSYLWSTGETTPTITVSQAGTYSLTVTDNNGCSKSASLYVPVIPIPTITANGRLDLCPGTSVQLTASAGSTFLWSNGATTQSITVADAGDYSVTVDGCTAASPVTVSNISNATITANGPTTICPGYSLDLTTDGGTNYLWSTGATSQTITVSEAGNYSVTFDAPDGCTKTASQQITVQPLAKPELSAQTLDVCGQGRVTFNVTNAPDYPLTYTPTHPDSLYIGGSYFTTAYPNTYTVTATDELGCNSVPSDPVTITEAPGNPDTFGDNVWNVYLFNNGYTYTYTSNPWQHYLHHYYGTFNLYQGYYVENNLSFDTRNRWDENGSPANAAGFQGCNLPYGWTEYFSWSAKRKGFPCGNYSINIPVHDDDAELFINGVMVWQQAGFVDNGNNVVWQGILDANSTVEFRVLDYEGGCVGAIEINPTKPAVTPGGPLTVCANSFQTLTSSAITGNVWNTGDTTQSINVNSAGNYFVTVNGDAGCTVQSDPVQVTVAQPQALYADADGDGYGSANNTIYACATPGYVTDNTDCNDHNAAVHSGSIPPKPTISGSTQLCPSKTIKLTSSSATTYLWSNNATTKTITASAPGSYTVTITKTSGCENTSDPFTVSVAPCIAPLNLSVTNVTSTGATLNWNASNCAVNYKVQVRKAGAATWKSYTATSNTYTVTGLVANKNYEWQVQTVCNVKPLTASDFVAGTNFKTASSPAANYANDGFSSLQYVNDSSALLKQNFDASITPNPAQNTAVLTIKGNAENLTVITMDIAGKILWRKDNLSDKNILLPVPNLSNGTYLIVLQSKEGTKVLKLIKAE